MGGDRIRLEGGWREGKERWLELEAIEGWFGQRVALSKTTMGSHG